MESGATEGSREEGEEQEQREVGGALTKLGEQGSGQRAGR
jgi:hypothetical protein